MFKFVIVFLISFVVSVMAVKFVSKKFNSFMGADAWLFSIKGRTRLCAVIALIITIIVMIALS